MVHSKEQPREVSIRETNINVEIVNDRSGLNAGPVVAEIELRPMEQLHIFLGECDTSEVVKGFVVELNPGIVPPDSVIAQVVRMRGKKSDELVLHTANYSDRIVCAEVRRLVDHN